MKKTLLSIILLAFFALGCRTFQPSIIEPPITHIRTEAAQRYLLDNGMTVIIKEIRTSPLVSLEALVKSGATAEGKFMGSGISHFVEHMLFKGTSRRGVGEIERQIKSCGGKIDGFTSYDYTGYRIVVPSEHFEEALDILADALMNPSFDKAELEREREVILKEIRLNRDDPHRKLSRLFWSSAYSAHPYRHPIIGHEDLFRKLTRDEVIEYHRLTYIPNNIVLAVAGDVERKTALAEIKKVFQDFERKPLSPTVLPVEPPQVNTKRAEERYDVGLTYLFLGFHTVSINSKDLYPLDVLAIILGEGDSSRLYRKIYKERGLVYSISAWNYTPKYPGIFGIVSSLEEKNLEEAIEAIISEIEELKWTLAKRQELKEARSTVLAKFLFAQEKIEEQASELAWNEAIVGDFNFSERYIAGINSVQREDIRRVARLYLNRDNLTIACLLPKGDEVIEDKVKGKVKDTAIEKAELSNGLTVLLRENHSLPIISIKATFCGGVRVEDEDNNGICNLTSQMLLKGTRLRSADQIARLIESIGGQIEVYCGNNSFGISMELLSRDLDIGLELLSDILINSTFPIEELQRQRQKVISQIKSQEDDIFMVSSNLLRQTLFKSHPYRLQPIGTTESIERMRQEDLIKFYRSYCVPNNMVLAIFGDIDPQHTLKKIESRFDKFIPGQLPQIDIPDEPEQRKIREVTKYVERQQAVIMIGFHGIDVTDEDRYTFEVLTSIVSREGSRMYEQIRERMGLAYTLGSYSILGIDPGYYVFYVATTVESIQKVRAEIIRQIEELKADYVSNEEMVLAKRSLIGLNRIGLQTNSSLAFKASLDELYGLGFERYREYERKINDVTKEDVMRIANRYFGLNAYAAVFVMPKKE